MKHLFFALLCCLWQFAFAQTSAKPAAPDAAVPVVAERLAWTALRGHAIDLTVGADGTAFSLDPEGLVWMRRPGPTTGWVNLPGVFARIDAASERSAWALDAEGQAWRYNGTFWQMVANDSIGAPTRQRLEQWKAKMPDHGDFEPLPGHLSHSSCCRLRC